MRDSIWLQRQLVTNRDFSAGWNSALWEVREAQMDGYDGEYLSDLVDRMLTWGAGAVEGTAPSTGTAQAGSPGSPSVPSTASDGASVSVAEVSQRLAESWSDFADLMAQEVLRRLARSVPTSTAGSGRTDDEFDPLPSFPTRGTLTSISTPSSEASRCLVCDPAMSGALSTFSSTRASAPPPSSESLPPFASPSEPLSGTGPSPTTPPTSESSLGSSEILSVHYADPTQTQSWWLLPERGWVQSFDSSSDQGYASEKPSGSTRGTSSSTKDSSESESPRPGCVPSRSATMPSRPYVWPLMPPLSELLTPPSSSLPEDEDDFVEALLATPFLVFCAKQGCQDCRRTLSDTEQRLSCWLTDIRCALSPSSSDTPTPPSQPESMPTSFQKLSELLSVPLSVVRNVWLDWLLYGEIHLTNADGGTRLDPAGITYRVPDRVPNDPNPCSGTSDCGSEGYGFKPRRPPHHKHESDGQTGPVDAPSGHDGVPDRVPA